MYRNKRRSDVQEQQRLGADGKEKDRRTCNLNMCPLCLFSTLLPQPYLVRLALDREREDGQTGLREHRLVLEVRLHGGDHQAAHALGPELRHVGQLWGW